MTAPQLEKPEQKSVRELDVSGLKKFAKALPQGSALREVLLGEDDRMPVDVFISRFPVWMQLLKIEGRRH